MSLDAKPLAVDLFSGAGGLSIGLKNAGFHIVLANEIEEDFARTFMMNHSSTNLLCNDIHEIDFAEELNKMSIKNVDLVAGGPPCQGFSTVGARNEKDPRNSLFHEFLRAIAEINPHYLIFENVAGFYSMYNGATYRKLINELGELGYDTRSALLDGSDFGLPQIRKRTIVIGWKKGLSEVALPASTHFDGNSLFHLRQKLTLMDAISDLPALEANDAKFFYTKEPQNEYQYCLRNGAKNLTEHNSANYGPRMLEILSSIPPGGTVNDLPPRLTPKKCFANTYARLSPNQPVPTITRNFGTPSSSRCVHPFQNRALSTREGARLQGFPDTYIFYGSKVAKNLQIGNAVPPILGEVIAKEIIKASQRQREVSNSLDRNTVTSPFQARLGIQ
ncbi:MAG: DNA cytosine methyltransferase [Deltaproteobacteria bacterium]|nr:DNA cytosine methyltransferase [Deltaproteobacteria bacterium]